MNIQLGDMPSYELQSFPSSVNEMDTESRECSLCGGYKAVVLRF